METQQKEINIGSRVLVEQAYEDEQGNFHDEFATVKNILGDAIYLLFDRPEIDEFLDGMTYEQDELQLV
jgi:hypothetical protein